MAMWMLWAATVTLLLGASAHLGERILRDLRWAVRWVWLGALAGAVALQLWGLVRRPVAETVSRIEPGATASSIDVAWLATVQQRAVRAMPVIPEPLDDLLVVGWIVGAMVLTFSMLVGLHRLQARAATWESTEVEGDEVLVSPDFGPALLGVVSPKIVVPSWALGLSSQKLRLVHLHEAEHRAARDSLMLFVAALVATMTPWNPGSWWILRRIHAAVEMDCDQRVLKAGAPRQAYAKLLLDIGSARGRSRVPVLALARDRSLLERRMRMMMNRVSPISSGRSMAAGALAIALVSVACEMPVPTTSEDVAGTVAPVGAVVASDVESNPLAGGGRLHSAEDARVLLDGVEFEGELSDISPDDVERIEVQKTPDGSAGTIHIFTKDAPAAGEVSLREVQPTIFVDGTRMPADFDVESLDRDDIARVEVHKGPGREEGGEVHIFLK